MELSVGDRKDYVYGLSEREKRDLTENVYVLVHGVESRAKGMKRLREDMRGAEKYGGKFPYPYDRVHVHNYRRFPILFLGLPISYLLNIRKVYSDYFGSVMENKSRLYPDANLNVVAHSWGTFQFEQVLTDDQFNNLSFGHVILLGSVMHEKFEWEEIIGERVQRVDNYVGRFDYMQWLSSLGFVGMGGSGRYGFRASSQTGQVNDFYTNWEHSGYSQDEALGMITDRILDYRDSCMKGG